MYGPKTVSRILAVIGLMCLLSGCDLIGFIFPKDGLRQWRDRDGNLVVRAIGRTFPEHRSSNPRLRVEDFNTSDVKLVIPPAFKPEVLSGRLYVNIQLPHMKPWDPEPSFPPELHANLRLYGQPSLSDPERLKRFQDLRQASRMQKRVVVELLAPAFTMNRIKETNSKFAFKYDPDEPPGVLKRLRYGSSEYVRDKDVAGLRRFSYMHCYSPGELEPTPQLPQDKQHLRRRAFLKHKPADDPTPENCRLNRHNSFFVTPENVPLDDAVFIECSPVIWQCDVRFEAGGRAVKLSIEEYDVPLWGNFVDPIRKLINGFVEKAAPSS